MACRFSLHHLPLLVVFLFLATFFTTYFIAVFMKHVEADFPYISDTGTFSPESCIFGQMLNICAVLVWLLIYIRYKQVQEYNQHNDHILRCNTASLVLGSISAFGISMVANFQESNVLPAHLTGAIMAFGVGALYLWLSVYVSFRTHPEMNTRWLCLIRLLFCLLTSVTFICTYVLDSFAKKRFHGTNPKKWFPKDGGFPEHIASTACEWTMATCFLVFFSTFVPDFSRIHLTAPQVTRRITETQPSPLLVEEPNIL